MFIVSVFAPYYPSETKGGEGEEADQNEKKPTSVLIRESRCQALRGG
jgi:hypothetical protein